MAKFITWTHNYNIGKNNAQENEELLGNSLPAGGKSFMKVMLFEPDFEG